MTEARHDQLVLTDETLHTQFAEAYRALRSDILFSSAEGSVRTILVTSALAREGKTTTVINLGVIMAQAGPRVLIVDADFRSPSLHHAFGFLPNGKTAPPGLSTVIAGSAHLDDVLVPTGFTRVTLVPAGAMPRNPNELLSSPRMKVVLAGLSELADVVLIDSPPCALYSDAYVLAPLTDGVLYVVRSGSHDRDLHRRVHRRLERAKARMLGVVFNGAEGKAAGLDVNYAPRGSRQR